MLLASSITIPKLLKRGKLKIKIIVALTGASGSIYGIRLLQVLKELGIETNLIITPTAEYIIENETKFTVRQVRKIADRYYDVMDLKAPIASGSFRTDGMIIAPCSMKTLAAVAHGFSTNLVARAADVVIKERRPLTVLPRETPLSIIHIKNMLLLAEAGAIILPPIPAFYSKPKTIDDLVNHTVGKILDMHHIEHKLYRRWG